MKSPKKLKDQYIEANNDPIIKSAMEFYNGEDLVFEVMFLRCIESLLRAQKSGDKDLLDEYSKNKKDFFEQFQPKE